MIIQSKKEIKLLLVLFFCINMFCSTQEIDDKNSAAEASDENTENVNLEEEEEIEILRNEITFPLTSTYIFPDSDLQVLDTDTLAKIEMLENRGYSQYITDVSWEDRAIYWLVYREANSSNSYITHRFEENGITYRLKWGADKRTEPNFYSYASFVANGRKYHFLKINFLLQYTKIQEWWNTKLKISRYYKLNY